MRATATGWASIVLAFQCVSAFSPTAWRGMPMRRGARTRIASSDGSSDDQDEAARIAAFREKLMRQMGGGDGGGFESNSADGTPPRLPETAEESPPSTSNSFSLAGLPGSPVKAEPKLWARPLELTEGATIPVGTLLIGNPEVFCSESCRKVRRCHRAELQLGLGHPHPLFKSSPETSLR